MIFIQYFDRLRSRPIWRTTGRGMLGTVGTRPGFVLHGRDRGVAGRAQYRVAMIVAQWPHFAPLGHHRRTSGRTSCSVAEMWRRLPELCRMGAIETLLANVVLHGPDHRISVADRVNAHPGLLIFSLRRSTARVARAFWPGQAF